MKTFLLQLLLLFLCLSGVLTAQTAAQWERKIVYSNTGSTAMYVFQQTQDGGYVMAGASEDGIYGEKTEGNRGMADFWIVKLRPDRSFEWDKTYGGTGFDRLTAVVPTSDGGYLLGGTSNSAKGFEKSENYIGVPNANGVVPMDYWLVKISANGNKQWDKTYGSPNEDLLRTLKAASDGGFVLGGSANGKYDVLKLNSSGDLQWHKSYGNEVEFGTVSQTSDKGYIIAGNTKPPQALGYQIIKVNETGVVQWEKIYEDTYYNRNVAATQISDGGYIITGETMSGRAGDKSEDKRGFWDTWVLKLNADGSLAWDKTLGGGEILYDGEYIGSSELYFFEETGDGNIVLAGSSNGKMTEDKSSDVTGAWMVTLDQAGKILGDLTLPYYYRRFAKTQDGGFLIGNYDSVYEILKFSKIRPTLPQSTLRINAGGPDFTTATKKLFVADKYYTGIDRTSSVATGDILNTTNDVLYRSGRSSPSFSYNIPVVNGDVNVALHFSETYFGVPGTKGEKGGAGSRQFHVNIEGDRKLTNYDIFAAAGGAMRANQITIPVTVTDGVLNIDFLAGAADLPRVCAIEIVPFEQRTLTFLPEADAYIRGGIYSQNKYGEYAPLDIKHVAGDADATRSSYLKFELPANASLTSAKLRIYGHNHENTKSISVHAYGVDNNNWRETGINKTNAPAASTASLGYAAVNDVYKYYEIDLTSYVKAQQQSGQTLVSLLLNDPNNRNTRIIFNSKEAGSNPPQLVIQTANSGARLGQEEIVTQVQERQLSTVFPNPIKDHFTVLLSPEHAGAIAFEMINAAGKSRMISSVQIAKPRENAEVNIAGQAFNSGVYLLKIKSDAFTEVVKMLVTE